MRERDREFLRSASIGIVHQDAREPRFLVRFSVGPSVACVFLRRGLRGVGTFAREHSSTQSSFLACWLSRSDLVSV
eukprot:15432133-Alexandrium_andersonii.AAC.1